MSKQSELNAKQKRRVAHRSKIRTKFVLESLRQEESKLRIENAFMKKVLCDSLPSHLAQEIISECCSRAGLSAVEVEDSCEEKSTLQEIPVDQLSNIFLHDFLQPLIQDLDAGDDDLDDLTDDQCIIDTHAVGHKR